MNPLPQISHHLFAAAAATEERPPRRTEQPEAARRTVKGIATAIPLELLSVEDELPEQAARPLRAAAVGVGV